MIDAHPYLTRLNTFISPDEMNKDPFFFETQGLANVSNVHTAMLRTMCGDRVHGVQRARAPGAVGRPAGVGARRFEGNDVPVPALDVVDTTANLPALEVAWERAESGEGMRVIDNTGAIRTAVAANNARYPNEQQMADPIRRQRWLRLSGRWRRRRQDLACDVAGRVPAAGARRRRRR